MCEEYDQTCSNKYLNKCIPQHSRMHVVQYMCGSYAHEHVCIRVRMSACVRMAHICLHLGYRPSNAPGIFALVACMLACSVQVMVSVYVDEHDAANKVGPAESLLSVLLRTMVATASGTSSFNAFFVITRAPFA